MARFLVFLAFFFLKLLVASSAFANSNENAPSEITIKSHWGGLGTPQQTEIVIRKKDGKYYLGHDKVDANMIEKLVSALNAPAISEPNLANLGISPQWLKDNALSGVEKAAPNFDDAAQNQKDLFIKSFNNPEALQEVVPRMFHFVKFDDYPSASVIVTFDDGSSLSAESHAWYEFMLPWKLSRNGETTYNADISRAIAALMPKKTINRERLAGQEFAANLAESMMRYIESDWKLLGTENRLGDALASIRAEYAVERAEVNPYHHPEYGIEWKAKQPHETNLHATLHKSGTPPNYVVALVLRVNDNKTEGLDRFLNSSHSYEALPWSIPWLADFIHQNPKILVRVSYVHDSSFGEKAMRVFSNDMHAIGRDNLIEEVKAQQSEITLLIIGIEHAESYWLVFPDKHIVLWRYAGPSGLLNWKQADLSTSRCSEYQGVGGGCVGLTVSPEGVLSKTTQGPD